MKIKNSTLTTTTTNISTTTKGICKPPHRLLTHLNKNTTSKNTSTTTATASTGSRLTTNSAAASTAVKKKKESFAPPTAAGAAAEAADIQTAKIINQILKNHHRLSASPPSPATNTTTATTATTTVQSRSRSPLSEAAAPISSPIVPKLQNPKSTKMSTSAKTVKTPTPTPATASPLLSIMEGNSNSNSMSLRSVAELRDRTQFHSAIKGWQCSLCSFENKPTRLLCEQCRASSSEGHACRTCLTLWVCSHCGARSDELEPHCLVCERTRDATAKQISGWYCVSCGCYFNLPESSACVRCGLKASASLTQLSETAAARAARDSLQAKILLLPLWPEGYSSTKLTELWKNLLGKNSVVQIKRFLLPSFQGFQGYVEFQSREVASRALTFPLRIPAGTQPPTATIATGSGLGSGPVVVVGLKQILLSLEQWMCLHCGFCNGNITNAWCTSCGVTQQTHSPTYLPTYPPKK